MGGSGEGVEGVISWILVVPARAVGMEFAYGLGGFEKKQTGFSRIHPFLLFLFLVLRGG